MKDWFCIAVGALGSAIASLYGGWDAALQTLIIFMAVDYVTGLLVAGVFHASPKSQTGALESRAGWKGLIRKGETLSIIENAGLMGLPIPAALTKAVDILKQRSETEQKGE